MCLRKKLKILKAKIKIWNKQVFCSLDLNICKLSSDMIDRDWIISEGGDMEDIAKLKEVRTYYWNNICLKDRLLKHKSWAKWIRESDDSARFFHACIRNRKRSNKIVSLTKDGEPLVEVEEVKNMK